MTGRGPAASAAGGGRSGPPDLPPFQTRAPFLARLDARLQHTRSALCLGIDPHPDLLPRGFSGDVRGVEGFASLLLRLAGPHASAVKLNLAFFEAFGSAGLVALERLRASVPADLPVILDAKRADIGSTAERHAAALFDALGADAVTANPYLGRDALEPFLARADRFVYVLCRTSNAGAGEFQDMNVSAQGEHSTDADAPCTASPLYLHVAAGVRAWDDGRGRLGLVVGATAPREMVAVREAAPDLAFLVPGAGVQGGDAAAVLPAARATAGAAGGLVGGGALINVSRAIASAALDGHDPEEAVDAAARRWARRLQC